MNVLDKVIGNNYTLYQSDCVEAIRGILDNTIDMSVYSPPFASLYTYSNSDRDMGNCKGGTEFADAYRHLVKQMLRVHKPGRISAVHCMNLPTSKVRDGYIGIQDFRGEIIRIHREAGWIYHSEVLIWKDPVTAMQRTKALGLLHKQIKKDSTMSRQGIPDYLCVFRKPGVNPEPVTHTPEDLPVELWQRYASPVWALIGETRPDGFADCGQDINPTDTLQYQSARDNNDERHICPLQLEVIRRAAHLWSNRGDVILSPFAGIGSEGHVALNEGRRFVGFELKKSYFDCAKTNLAKAEPNASGRQIDLFAAMGLS
jgi:hypothetical protein